MVVPLLSRSLVTKGLREALPFLEGLVARNPKTSIDGILAAGRNAGLTYPNEQARSLVRQLKANLDIRNLLKVKDFDKTIPESSMEIATTKLRRDYSYLVRIRGLDESAGIRVEREVYVSSDMLLTPNEIFETVEGMENQGFGSDPLKDPSMTIIAAKINPLAL